MYIRTYAHVLAWIHPPSRALRIYIDLYGSITIHVRGSVYHPAPRVVPAAKHRDVHADIRGRGTWERARLADRQTARPACHCCHLGKQRASERACVQPASKASRHAAFACVRWTVRRIYCRLGAGLGLGLGLGDGMGWVISHGGIVGRGSICMYADLTSRQVE